MNLMRILVLLLAATCSAQTSLFDVTIGKPVNAKLRDCDSSEYSSELISNPNVGELPCVKSHDVDESSAGSASGTINFPGDVGTVEYRELDGKVEFISGLYNNSFENEVVSELRKKFGPPSDVSRVKYRNGFGIEFYEHVASWHRKDAEIRFYTRYTNADTCGVEVWTYKWRRYSEKQASGKRVF